MLEEQLATSRRRVETVVELESEMMKYRQQIEQLSAVSTSITVRSLCTASPRVASLCHSFLGH